MRGRHPPGVRRRVGAPSGVSPTQRGMGGCGWCGLAKRAQVGVKARCHGAHAGAQARRAGAGQPCMCDSRSTLRAKRGPRTCIRRHVGSILGVGPYPGWRARMRAQVGSKRGLQQETPGVSQQCPCVWVGVNPVRAKCGRAAATDQIEACCWVQQGAMMCPIGAGAAPPLVNMEGEGAPVSPFKTEWRRRLWMKNCKAGRPWASQQCLQGVPHHQVLGLLAAGPAVGLPSNQFRGVG